MGSHRVGHSLKDFAAAAAAITLVKRKLQNAYGPGFALKLPKAKDTLGVQLCSL